MLPSRQIRLDVDQSPSVICFLAKRCYRDSQPYSGYPVCNVLLRERSGPIAGTTPEEVHACTSVSMGSLAASLCFVHLPRTTILFALVLHLFVGADSLFDYQVSADLITWAC